MMAIFWRCIEGSQCDSRFRQRKEGKKRFLPQSGLCLTTRMPRGRGAGFGQDKGTNRATKSTCTLIFGQSVFSQPESERKCATNVALLFILRIRAKRANQGQKGRLAGRFINSRSLLLETTTDGNQGNESIKRPLGILYMKRKIPQKKISGPKPKNSQSPIFPSVCVPIFLFQPKYEVYPANFMTHKKSELCEKLRHTGGRGRGRGRGVGGWH